MQKFTLILEDERAEQFIFLGYSIPLEEYPVEAKNLKKAKELAPPGRRLAAVERGGVTLYYNYRCNCSYSRTYKNA